MQDLTSAAATYYHHQSLPQQPPELLPEQEHLKCPRCDSSNTKFCYYNNYNLSQPRHYCKSCRRYWTKGGSLRNIPVGGGSRKNNKKPGSGSGSGSSSSNKTISVSDQRQEEEKSNSGQEMDPTRMLYGLPVGAPSFSSLLASNMYGTGSARWYPGLGSGIEKSGDDTWTDLVMYRVEKN
ncbi:hypothetical protein AALP_AA4G042500 [Arabis alpina]|uniref:Dof zinc finger protein n=1 Tax=Arabis alpina TaxID=50452 RepID=A0A087H126_ARAAL|nr:hypothetical protein AALP_AA4G042500 [Arabis alpina]